MVGDRHKAGIRGALVFYLVFVFLCLLFFAAGAFAENPSPFAAGKTIGEKAPDVTLKDVEGKALPLSSFKGKVILLHFWATWCPPCRAEIPELNELHQRMKGKAFAVYAISTDGSVEDVKDFMRKHRIQFPVVVDVRGAQTKGLYKVFMMPTSFLIDKKGVVVDLFFGEQEWTEPAMIRKIEALL